MFNSKEAVSTYNLKLKDGIMDFSGSEIIYRKIAIEKGDLTPGLRLPYTIHEVQTARKPEAFIKFMESNFPDAETREAMLYYLSLIPTMETGFKYFGVFYGGYATGKTATVEVMRKVFPGCIENIPHEVLFKKKSAALAFIPLNFADKGAGVIPECPHDVPICVPTIKKLVGGDTITVRKLYEAPRDIIPTAQIIICTSKVIRFDAYDAGLDKRLLVIPFLQKHERENPQTKLLSEILIDLQEEYPGIARLLIEYFINLKEAHNGIIPQSAECLKYKKWFIEKPEIVIFADANIEIDTTGNNFETVTAVYDRYLKFFGITDRDNEGLSRSKFIRYLKQEYREIELRQKIVDDQPTVCFFNLKLKSETDV